MSARQIFFPLILLVAIEGRPISLHNYAPEHGHNSYSFSYGVRDLHSGDIKHHWEKKNGDMVQGSYSVVQPDGLVRTVDYSVHGKSGFNAVVKHNEPVRHKTEDVVKTEYHFHDGTPEKDTTISEYYHRYHKALPVPQEPKKEEYQFKVPKAKDTTVPEYYYQYQKELNAPKTKDEKVPEDYYQYYKEINVPKTKEATVPQYYYQYHQELDSNVPKTSKAKVPEYYYQYQKEENTPKAKEAVVPKYYNQYHQELDSNVPKTNKAKVPNYFYQNEAKELKSKYAPVPEYHYQELDSTVPKSNKAKVPEYFYQYPKEQNAPKTKANYFQYQKELPVDLNLVKDKVVPIDVSSVQPVEIDVTQNHELSSEDLNKLLAEYYQTPTKPETGFQPSRPKIPNTFKSNKKPMTTPGLKNFMSQPYDVRFQKAVSVLSYVE